MSQAPRRCPECGTEADRADLLCPACDHVLEESHYLRTIAASLGLAAVTVLLVLPGFSLRETVMLTTSYLLVLYPASKLVHKGRDPSRSILLEMGSVFSGRFDRLGVMVVLAIAIAFASGLRFDGQALETSIYVQWRQWVSLATMAMAAVAVSGMIYDQGFAFFDLRIANTYARRGTRSASHQDAERRGGRHRR